MKKQLFVVALFAASLVLASCKGGGGSSEITAISISPKSVVLNENESTVRLGLKYTPSDAKKPEVTWSSSDTLVATVTSTGFVEAVSYGECYIYAQVGELKDSCLVEVKTYLESLIFNSAIVWDEDTTYAMDPETGKLKVDTIQSSSGQTYLAYKSLANLRIFSDGFYVNNSGHIDGTEVGTIIDVYAPMYYATATLNKSDRGTIFCLGEWVVTGDTTGMKIGKPGKIEDEAEYVNQMKQFIASYNAGEEGYSQFLKAAGDLVVESSMTILEYDAEGEGYYSSYIPDAIVDLVDVSLNTNFLASDYMCGLDFSYVKFTPFAGDWGMNMKYDSETKQLTLLDEQIHMADPIISQYGSLDAAPKAMNPINVPVISENPALKAQLEREIKERGIVVLKAKF